MEIKILGVCRDLSTVDSSFIDIVTTPDNIGMVSYDYIVDLNEVVFLKDPRPFIKPLYEAIYSDFFDKNGVIRLNSLGLYPGVLVKRKVYESVGFDMDKINLRQYIPRVLFKMI